MGGGIFYTTFFLQICNPICLYKLSILNDYIARYYEVKKITVIAESEI